MYEGLSRLQPVILAGGTSSRMGYNKVFAEFGNSTLIETIYTLLAFTFEKTPIIVTDNRKLFEGFEPLRDAIIIEDTYPGHKTLGAVTTALEATDADTIFVVGVDMPFISLGVLEKMAEAQSIADVVVPKLDGQDICLHAIYNKKLLPLMKKHIKQGAQTLHSFYKDVAILQVPITDNEEHDPDIFIDINTPEDLAFAQEMWAKHK